MEKSQPTGRQAASNGNAHFCTLFFSLFFTLTLTHTHTHMDTHTKCQTHVTHTIM